RMNRRRLHDARQPQTLVARTLSGAPVPIAQRRAAAHAGRAQARLQAQPRYVHTIEVVDRYAVIGGGCGGFRDNHGYDWYRGI
ncbi:MAG: molybdopterin oxidoreductase, partial [Chloroflexota bacterium]|nr:molybdopterin oxidoreductase [Chloroflexota bacterium]